MAERSEAVDILLDTCALLWLAEAPERLSPAAQSLLAETTGRIYLSAFSAFEIAVKQKKGKLELPAPAEVWFPDALARLGLEEIPVSAAIALHAVALPIDHGDPGDRIVIATAQIHHLLVVTADQPMLDFLGKQGIW